MNVGDFIIWITGTITNVYQSIDPANPYTGFPEANASPNPSPSHIAAFVLKMKNVCNEATTVLTGYSSQNTFDYPAGNP